MGSHEDRSQPGTFYLPPEFYLLIHHPQIFQKVDSRQSLVCPTLFCPTLSAEAQVLCSQPRFMPTQGYNSSSDKKKQCFTPGSGAQSASLGSRSNNPASSQQDCFFSHQGWLHYNLNQTYLCAGVETCFQPGQFPDVITEQLQGAKCSSHLPWTMTSRATNFHFRQV